MMSKWMTMLVLLVGCGVPVSPEETPAQIPQEAGKDMRTAGRPQAVAGRLRVGRQFWASDEGLVNRVGTWERIWDSELGTFCYPGSAEDGQLRCLPQQDASVSYFREPDCTTPVAIALSCVKPRWALRAETGMCGATPVYYRTTDKVYGDVYFNDGQKCIKVVLPATQVAWNVQYMPPTAFAPLYEGRE